MGGIHFLNKMSGAKRRSYSGSFQHMHFLKVLVKRAGREFGICEKKSLRTGMACRACLCPALLLSPPLRTSLDWPSYPAALVTIGALFSVWLSVRLHTNSQIFKRWEFGCGRGVAD